MGSINLGTIKKLVVKEGWTLKHHGSKDFIEAWGEEYPLVHPVNIHLKRYRTLTNPELRYTHLRAAHDYLWPHQIKYWNFWTERRFKTHCEDWHCVVYAGGASTGKSYDAAKLALLFWLANPKKRAVLVMSTTLESLNSRIYGYCCRLLTELAVPLPFRLRKGNNPKIEYPGVPDATHAICAVSAKKGDDETSISSLIGRHPTEGLMIVADEAPDLPIAILGAMPNLSTAPVFQFVAIGNSLSRFDLHGSLATPKEGWDSVDPNTHTSWETTQKKGICLFFSCYESPAIHEPEAEKRTLLSSFFITSDEIKEKQQLYGEDSLSFSRFVLGFWPKDAPSDTIITEKFLREYNVSNLAEWSGLRALHIVGGLDPAFSQDGDQCILRLAILGHDISGKMVLDFRRNELMFKIPIIPNDQRAAELQIADRVGEILRKYKCPLGNVCIDANGSGRALGEVIRLRTKELKSPIKIYATAVGSKVKSSFDVTVRTNYELWEDFKKFTQTEQLKGLDNTTLMQITTRLTTKNPKTGKMTLETKQEYKKRMTAAMPTLAHSPDEADATALCIQAAKILFGFAPGQIYKLPEFEDHQAARYHMAMVAQTAENQAVEVKHMPAATFSSPLEKLTPHSPFSRV